MERVMVSRRRLLGGAALLALGVLVRNSARAQAKAASSYNAVRLFGVDYVDVQDLGRRFALSPEWGVPQKKIRLRSQWTTLEFAADSIELWLNGLKLFLGEPVVSRSGTLFIGRSDAEQMLGPILSPGSARPVPTLRTIVIDPGHGGNDPGNQNQKLKLTEKIFTLDVAKRLERLLKAQGYRVVLTRTADRRVDLDQRTDIARQARADLFISIHFNGFSAARVSGTETFVMPPRHQRSSPQAERDKNMVSTNFPSNKFDHWNILLGYHMHRQMVQHLKLQDRGLKRFRYRVLCTAECPAVLVEAAFLSNEAEGQKVATPAYRQQIAVGIAAGVKANATALAGIR
jgi:N-acetylmuramoyl-L-alanine amidase